ncbi:MAG TPA: 30S ribosomal protein S2 [Candidatus Parcubacteria bacterium]|nr:30S ribosomal protein S2 [Candidatus Parcubacteria bacterium]
MSENKNENNEFNLKIEEMANAGLQFGHHVSKTYPKMSPYISGVKNTIHLIDLEKSVREFSKTLYFLKKLVREGKIILVVGTKIQMKDLVRQFAEELGFPYINERWLGGTITNFPIIKKRIEYFRDLENKREKGELEKYTKKERAKFDKEIKDLEIKFGGIKNMESVPDAIFVLDVKKDELAVREARKKRIPVIGIVDTNINPELVDYLIPANDDAISSVKYILEKIKEAIKKE